MPEVLKPRKGPLGLIDYEKVFTPSLAHAMAAYEHLDYGGVLVNDAPTFRADNYPYGGTRDSGIGREGVRAAMEELTESKVLVLRAG